MWTAPGFRRARDRMVQAVRAVPCRSSPLLPGIPRQDLRGREYADAPPFLLDALLAAAKDLSAEGEIVRLRSSQGGAEGGRGAGAGGDRARLRIGRAGGSVVPEVLAKSGVEPARARSLLQILLREKRLVRVNEELVFHRAAIDGLRAALAAHKSERFNVSAFKEWTGISRKYAIPLLEYLDREHVTRREGDERLVL